MLMRTIAAGTILVLALGAVAGDHAGKLPFDEDYRASLESAKKTGRPVVVFFTSDG